MAHFDESSESWGMLASTVDESAGVVRAETTRSGVFGLAVLGVTAQATSTPETPSVGDSPPPFALLIALSILGLLLVATGVRLMSSSKAPSQAV